MKKLSIKNHYLLKKLKSNLKAFPDLKENDRILVSVSGGVDSVALLVLLNELDSFQLITVHINHKLRKESDFDEQFVKDMSRHLNIPFRSKSLDPKSKPRKQSMEEWGREERYLFLKNTLIKDNGHWIMTEHHAKKLGRFAPRVVLAYDADKAGQAAAERVYGWEEQFELEFAVAELPEGSDPGDLARHDPAALRRAIEEAKPFLQFRIEQELKRGDLSTPEGRARTAANAGHLAMEHPNPMVSDPYIMQIADQCLVTPDQLRTLLQNTVPQQSTNQKNAQIQDKQEEVLHAQIPAVEKQALQFFLHRKDEIKDYLMPVLFLSTAGQLIYEALKETEGDLHAAREQTDESLSSVLLEIAAGDVIDEDPLGILSRLLALAAKQKADELSSIARQEDSFDDLLEDINFLRRQTDALSEAPQSIEPLEPLLEWFRGIPS